MARINYEYGRVFGRYVHNKFCNRVIFERIMHKIDYKLVFFTMLAFLIIMVLYSLTNNHFKFEKKKVLNKVFSTKVFKKIWARKNLNCWSIKKLNNHYVSTKLGSTMPGRTIKMTHKLQQQKRSGV